MALDKTGDTAPVLPSSALEIDEAPSGVDRRTFLMRSAVVSSAALVDGPAISLTLC